MMNASMGHRIDTMDIRVSNTRHEIPTDAKASPRH